MFFYLNKCFLSKKPLSSGLLFFEHIGLFFSNFAFSVDFGRTLVPKGAYRPWDHFRFFGKTLLCIVNYLSNLGFSGFLLFLFSLYNLMILLGFSADGPRPRGGAGGGPLRFGRPHPLQAPQTAPGPTAAAAAVAHCGSGGPTAAAVASLNNCPPLIAIGYI